jgi:hypothetical protein
MVTANSDGYTTNDIESAYITVNNIQISETTQGNIQDVIPVTASAQSQVKAAGKTIGMQKTGLPINYLILAVLLVISGLLVPKRK